MSGNKSLEFLFSPLERQAFHEDLLAWYDANQRVLPWRAKPGERQVPYKVWLSEIMLQQTGVKVVAEYFHKFLHKWPTVVDLARAPVEEVLAAWAGLGYYSRARNLHACAQKIVMNGGFPDTPEELKKLPGIGPYTAAAISAIAFDVPVIAIDGNVERVFSRVFAIEKTFPAAKKDVAYHAQTLVFPKRAGDFCQALMDLGSLVCTPRKAHCASCPWQGGCLARQVGAPERFPIRETPQKKPRRYGAAFILENERKEILVRRRPDKGLLAGMLGFPSSPWQENALPEVELLSFAPCAIVWKRQKNPIYHTFTHFHLTLDLYRGNCLTFSDHEGGFWVSAEEMTMIGLPSVMKKCLL